MRYRSPQRFAGTLVALGLALTLSSSVGCEALGIGSGKPPPLPKGKSRESNAWRPAPTAAVRKLPSFGLGGPGQDYGSADPEPAAVANPTVAPGAGGPGTLNGNPNGLSRETLNVAIQGTMGSLATCFSPSAQNPMVAVSFEADPSGRASLVRVSGAPPDAERCVRNIMQKMRFPRFEGNGVHVDLPLTFHQVGRSQPAAPARQLQEPAGGGPPLNIDL
jgi:hypothetical protein